jgi:hypothetical protein
MRPLYAKINLASQLSYKDILHQKLLTTLYYNNNKESFDNINFGVPHLPKNTQKRILALVNR